MACSCGKKKSTTSKQVVKAPAKQKPVTKGFTSNKRVIRRTIR